MTCTKCPAASVPSRCDITLHPVPHRISAATMSTPRYRHTLPMHPTLGTAGISPKSPCTLMPTRTVPRSRLSRLPDIHAPGNISYPFRSRSPDPVSVLPQEVFPEIHPALHENLHSACSPQNRRHFDHNIELSDSFYFFRSFKSIIAYFQEYCNLCKIAPSIIYMTICDRILQTFLIFQAANWNDLDSHIRCICHRCIRTYHNQCRWLPIDSSWMIHIFDGTLIIFLNHFFKF